MLTTHPTTHTKRRQYSFDELLDRVGGIRATLSKASLNNVVEGSHATSRRALAKLAHKMDLKTDDIVFDLGVGVPRLALFFSHLTNKPTIGTDTG